MNDNEIEQEIQAKGLTAPRVTLKSVEAKSAYAYYITGAEIAEHTTPVLGATLPQVPAVVDITGMHCLTLCVLHLSNGFVVTGDSACASPENFDAELGRKIARQRAVDKLWALEGY